MILAYKRALAGPIRQPRYLLLDQKASKCLKTLTSYQSYEISVFIIMIDNVLPEGCTIIKSYIWDTKDPVQPLFHSNIYFKFVLNQYKAIKFGKSSGIMTLNGLYILVTLIF